VKALKTAGRPPTVLTIIVFALALFMFVLSVMAVWFWTPIDESFVNRADAAGDMSLLLPHQTGVWLVLRAMSFVSFLVSVIAFVAMWKSRTDRTNVQSGRRASEQLRQTNRQRKRVP